MIARPGQRVGRKPRSTFVYRDRDPDAVRKRAERTGGQFDMPFKSGFDTFRPKNGDNVLRFLPPTWDDADHFGLVVHEHRYIGADGGTYLCLRKMLGKPCAICDAALDAKENGEDEDAKQLAASERVIYWVLDRDAEDNSNPVIYDISWLMDRDITKLTQSRRDGSVLRIDHPDEGFDFTFTKTGAGIKTKYTSYQFDREPSPIDKDPRRVDQVLEFLEKNPLPEILLYQTNEYLTKVLDGTAKPADELEAEVDELEAGDPYAETEPERPARRTAAAAPRSAERQPRARLERETTRRREPEPEPGYEDDVPFETEAEYEEPIDDGMPDSYADPVDELEPEVEYEEPVEYEPEPPPRRAPVPQQRQAREPQRTATRPATRPVAREQVRPATRAPAPQQRTAAPAQRPVQRQAPSRYDDEPQRSTRPATRPAAPVQRRPAPPPTRRPTR